MDAMNQPNTNLSNFTSILSLIKTAKDRMLKTVNTEIIDLYWQIGKDFTFIGEEFRVQVGNSDFFIDLLLTEFNLPEKCRRIDTSRSY
jgi:predicted nuclease of restriction endonuclease-like (RecB) superfamily